MYRPTSQDFQDARPRRHGGVEDHPNDTLLCSTCESPERRGDHADPLCEIGCLRRRRTDRLTPAALARLAPPLPVGDPDGEVTVARWAAEQLCLAQATTDLTLVCTRRDRRIDDEGSH